jgi:hypothetical protein
MLIVPGPWSSGIPGICVSATTTLTFVVFAFAAAGWPAAKAELAAAPKSARLTAPTSAALVALTFDFEITKGSPLSHGGASTICLERVTFRCLYGEWLGLIVPTPLGLRPLRVSRPSSSS